MKIEKIILFCLMGLLAGCTTTSSNYNGPINSDNSDNTDNTNTNGNSGIFINDVNYLADKEIKKYPEDKQQHYIYSKNYFRIVNVNSEERFTIGLEAFMKTMEIGYIKEMNDRNLTNDEIYKEWESIYKSILVIDRFARENNLDRGDLIADLFGASTALLIYSNAEMDIKDHRR
jgi:hypothetical protein